ncbi:MAG: phenylalanine--tRNA ligase subunit alpha [Vicinamibacterales bacterium]
MSTDRLAPLSPESLADARQRFDAAVAAASTARDVQQVRDAFLGRKMGVVTSFFSQLGKAAAEERRELGRLLNELKTHVEARLDARKAELDVARRPTDAIDVTLAGRDLPVGRRHPLTIVRERIEQIFGRMGYEILDGPETEDDYHNFEALNMPADHPARDMQDTLYLQQPFRRHVWPVATGAPAVDAGAGAPATLLRTHTSNMQIRYMESHQPPLRVIAPGRVYRRDNLDVTHTPMFQQVEGLVVAEGITLSDLKGTLTAFARELLTPDTRVMFKPSFFPYTEPSAEMFVSCVHCRGDGCSVCKRTGWMEILGSGMVHPAVFEAVGYDPERYTGFAFGMGIERVALAAYRVDDIRLFYENDLRFLEQFPS